MTRAREQSSRWTSCWVLISRREDGDRLLVLDGDVLGDVHRQRGLAHAGPGGDDEHLGAVQAVGHFVEFGETGGQAGDGAAALVEFLDGLDGLHDLVLHRERVRLEALAGRFRLMCCSTSSSRLGTLSCSS